MSAEKKGDDNSVMRAHSREQVSCEEQAEKAREEESSQGKDQRVGRSELPSRGGPGSNLGNDLDDRVGAEQGQMMRLYNHAKNLSSSSKYEEANTTLDSN